jgi:hypothetical protein
LAKKKLPPKLATYPYDSVSASQVTPDPLSTRRIKSCTDARELYTRLYLENVRRAETWAQVRNQVEGGRPFDPDVLKRAGEEWRTNINFRDAQQAMNRVMLPYWKMVHEVPRKISVVVHEQSTDADKWGVAMAECFDMFLDDWGTDYQMQFMGRCKDYVSYGSSYAMWPDGSSPRYTWASASQMYFPKRTKASVEQWELCCLKRELTASQLWAKVRNVGEEKVSSEAGWNPDMVKLAISLCQDRASVTRFYDPNWYQDLITANDLVIGSTWPPITVVDLWAKNYDGKIRHYIFTEKTDVPDYLYEADEEAGEFDQIFGANFYDTGENCLLHTIKGFAVKNYHYATAINRTKCRLIDAATFAMGMNFVRTDNAPNESPPIENYSMVNFFPSGMQQLTITANIQEAMSVMELLKNNQDENNYTYNETKNDIADTNTARQASILANIGQEMNTATSSIYLAQEGAIFSEMVRRLRQKSGDKDAKKFQERLTERGVPDAAIFKSELTVKTGASPTMASPYVRAQIAQQIMQTIYPLPDANKRWIEEFYVANSLGSSGVNRALLPVGTPSSPLARRQAMMENVDLAQGVPLPVDPSDAHVEHCDEHLKPLEQMAQAAQQSMQQAQQPGTVGAPQQVPGQPTPQMTPDHLIAFQMGLPHIQAHMNYLKPDQTKKVAYQQLSSRFAQVSSIARGFVTQLSRNHMANQQAAGRNAQPMQAFANGNQPS